MQKQNWRKNKKTSLRQIYTYSSATFNNKFKSLSQTHHRPQSNKIPSGQKKNSFRIKFYRTNQYIKKPFKLKYETKINCYMCSLYIFGNAHGQTKSRLKNYAKLYTTSYTKWNSKRQKNFFLKVMLFTFECCAVLANVLVFRFQTISINLFWQKLYYSICSIPKNFLKWISKTEWYYENDCLDECYRVKNFEHGL